MGLPKQEGLDTALESPVIVSAHRRVDGAIVYRTGDGRWTTFLEEAAVATTLPAARTLLVAATGRDSGATGAHLVSIQIDADGRRRLNASIGAAVAAFPRWEAAR